MGIGYTNTIETQMVSNEIPFAPIPDVKFGRTTDNGNIYVFFQDPKDIYIDGQLVTKREKTIIVAKKGAPPENHLDGEHVYTHTGYHDVQKWLEFIPSYSDYSGAGAQLYIQFFAISTTGNVYPITRVYKLYTYIYAFLIEEDNPNPDTRVKPYFYGAASAPHPATPANWELVEPFKSIRPCLFKNGKVQYYLTKGDFTLKEDGSLSDIESGADGDVMIEFPNVHVNTDGRIVLISGIPFPPSSEYLPLLEGFDSLDNFYVSAYLGCEKEGELRSLAGREVVEKSSSETESLLNRKGQRYDLFPFWTLNAIQALFILKYKTTNSEVIGYGRQKLFFHETLLTGTTKSAPMDSGTIENVNQNVKLFGIEGLWGMESTRVSGIKPESQTSLRVDTNRDGSSFKIVPYTGAGHAGFMKNPWGRLLGFIPVPPLWEGSESTYFCDHFTNWGSGENFSDRAFFSPGGFLSESTKRSKGLFSSNFGYREGLTAIRFVYY